MFRTVPLSIIRSFSLYTQQWYMSYRFADSLRAGSGRNVLILLAISEISAYSWFYHKEVRLLYQQYYECIIGSSEGGRYLTTLSVAKMSRCWR